MHESVDSTMFIHVSDFSKTQQMCDKAVEKDSKMLKCVPDYFKTQEMCEKTVKNVLFAIITTKCDLIVLQQVNEISLTVNKFY